MKNSKILENTKKVLENFQSKDIELPVKINFLLQKNLKKLAEYCQEIEEYKIKLANKYGFSEDGVSYSIPPENVELVNKELQDLSNIEQNIEIYKVKFKDIPEDLKLTFDQMDALMFMIEEDE